MSACQGSMFVLVNVDKHRHVMGDIVRQLVTDYGVPISIVDNIQKICPKCSCVPSQSNASPSTPTPNFPALNTNCSSSTEECGPKLSISPLKTVQKRHESPMEDVTEVKRNRIESAEKSGEDDANEVFGSVLAALQNGSQDIKQEYGVSGNSSDGGVSNSSNVNEGEEEDYKTSPWTNPDFLTSFITSQPNIFGSGAIQNLSKATSALSKLIHLTIAEFDTVYPTELELAKDLMDAGLLHNARKCEKCSCKMALRNRKGTVEWRCRRSNKTDCSSKSIKAGSFFSESKLSLKQAMKFIIMWITECSGPQIELQLKLSKTTICDWRQFLRGICTRIVNSYPPIGGSGKVVEIGESVIQARKHAKVTTLNEEYILVLGGIERGTHRIWMHTVPNRTKETFNATIGKHVDKESTVITNMFPAFDDLGKMCNRHEMLNQSIESYRFTEDGLEVSTGLIENAWTRLKSNGSADNTLDSYLDEFVVRQWEGGQFFMTVLVEIQSCKTDYRN